MTVLRRSTLALAALLATTTTSLRAETDDPRRSRVAITAGARKATVGDVEDRVAEIPPFQLATLGASPREVVKAYVDQVIARDLLLIAGAEQRKLDQEPAVRQQIVRSRSTATLRALRGPIMSPAAVSKEDVVAYYEKNRARFESPERVNLWRIHCKTQDEAKSVLATAKGELTIPKWNDLARDHSMDKATSFRGGNLGFVGADGASNEAGLKVDPALVKAAAGVKDGELVPQPVPEGEGFAVVWRRTTVPATKRSLDEAEPQIRTAIFRERTEVAEKKLIDELRAKHVRDVNADLLRIVELPVYDAGISAPRATPSR